MKEEAVLQKLGLTEAEVKLYTTLLSIGEASASELAKKISLNRSFAYDRLSKLEDLGLVSQVIKDNKRYFMAADPSQFFHILKQSEEQLAAIIPRLESLKAQKTNAPRITVFSSKKGMLTALNLILKEKKQVHSYGSFEDFRRVMKENYEIWNQRRIKLKITMRILSSEPLSLEHTTSQLLPEEEKTNVTTFTFGSRVIVAFWSEQPVAILIESVEIARNNITFFNEVWNREVRIYSGVDGIVKAFYELIENKSGYYLGVGYSEELAKVYGTKLSDYWHETRLKNRVKARLIAYNDPKSRSYFKARSSRWKDFDVRFLDRTLCGPACATISDNLMATFIYTEGNFKVILNRNRETIAAYKKYFEQLWKLAGR